MSLTASKTIDHRALRPSRRRSWTWAHYLALLGIPFLVLQTWTTVAWLADGPYQITQFRDDGGFNWWAAHVAEAVCIGISIPILLYVVRGCIRERKILTFDAMFCLCGATIFWNDIANNSLKPVFLVSSNFVNLNNMCGHIPFMINPDCGRMPDPVLLFWPMDVFWILGLAIVAERGVRWTSTRWPALSTPQLFWLLIGGFFVFDLLLEGVAVGLEFWSYTTASAAAIPYGHGLRHAFGAVISGTLGFGLLVAIRVFKDDRGQTFIERGLAQLRSWRTGLTLLSLYGCFQLVLWVPGTVPMWVNSLYDSTWPRLPAHLVNGTCDASGFEGTRYGPCPGSPGYRMPGRHSLPGKSP